MAPVAKRRKVEPKVEAVDFDYDARYEYLTGFHKRKVQRTKASQEAAQRRARQERIDERKKLREERKAEIERHVSEVNALTLGEPAHVQPDDGSSEGTPEVWGGLEDADTDPVDQEAEYIDEDKYTTVTIEAVDVSRDGLSVMKKKTAESGDQENTSEPDQATGGPRPSPGSASGAKEKKSNDSHSSRKRKKRNFRYENKADRKMNRAKVRAKNAKAAAARKGKGA